jgi:GT2 family glycosyltransferase
MTTRPLDLAPALADVLTQPVQGRVSVILVNYNAGTAYLAPCFAALRAQTYDDVEILVVDNGSTDGSAEALDAIAAHTPNVRVIHADANRGFGGGNNNAAEQATGEFLAFLNLDTQVAPGWLNALVETLQTQPKVGLVTAKLMMMHQPDLINTCGNDVQIAGFGYLRGYLQPSITKMQPEAVASSSGAAFMMTAKLYRELGGFDARIFPAYGEDVDLSWRVRLAGYECWSVPASIVYHDYTTRFTPMKYHWLERHRLYMLLKLYRWQTLVVLLPALVLAEVISWGFGVLSGTQHLQAKLNSYTWIMRNWTTLMQARREAQAQRKVGDRVILQQHTHRLAYSQTKSGGVTALARLIFDPLFWLWRQIAMFIVRW